MILSNKNIKNKWLWRFWTLVGAMLLPPVPWSHICVFRHCHEYQAPQVMKKEKILFIKLAKNNLNSNVISNYLYKSGLIHQILADTAGHRLGIPFQYQYVRYGIIR